MNEAAWLACDDPRRMHEFLREKLSARKVRLFILACCHQLWGNSKDEATRIALAAAEQLAESGATRTNKAYVRVPAGQAVLDCGASDPLRRLDAFGPNGSLTPVEWGALPLILARVVEQSACWRSGGCPPDWPNWQIESFGEAGLSLARQAELFRDIVRGPFRPLLFRAAWRVLNGGASVTIAEAIYNEEAFEQLPILADALQDAGCDNDEVLDHLRGPGPHVRGCWVVDLLLGKC